MFKISMATKEQLPQVLDYLGFETNAFVMGCYEEGSLTGAVAFDIIDGSGVILSLKTQEAQMQQVVLSAALNFLDLNGIETVYSCQEGRLYSMMRFEKSRDKRYKMELSLPGYFSCEGRHEG